MSVFSVNGYFNDDNTPIQGCLVSEFDSTPEGYSDDDIFFYGIDESDLIGAHDDFTITSYEVL